MKDLKALTVDQLHDKHFDLMFEITYSTLAIRQHEKTLNKSAEELQLIDDELESRETPKLNLV
jgi:hypothetical protein